MAYVKLNKSGCEERRGNVKLRLDFYLEPTDPRYDERYLYLIDVTSAEYLAGYLGEVDEVGDPIDQEAYDKWEESLPHIWENTPFHSHFVHFGPDVTTDDIKAEIDFHCKNFYQAFQDRWDEVNGGMRHGWAVEKRVRPTDYSQGAERVAQCRNTVKKLTGFSYKPETIGGKTFPATAIDVGPGAINRASRFAAANNTLIDKANPANDTGTIDTFEVWAFLTMDGTNKAGIFYGSGTDYTSRDCEVIGTVTSGAKRTFTGLSIDVTTGDFAGIYWTVGQIEKDNSGGQDMYYVPGDQCGAGQQTYTLQASDAISIYGTGDTAAAITLELRASTSTRADTALDTAIVIAFKSATDTRAAIILDTQVAIHIRSPTATDARIALNTAVVIALRSSTDTDARLTLTVAGPTALELRSATDTDAQVVIGIWALFEYYITGDNGTGAIFGDQWNGQTFTPSIEHSIEEVKLKLLRLGSPGTVTVSIQGVDGSDHPDGVDLCSGTTDGDTLTTDTDGEWRTIIFSPNTNLSANTKYAIVVKALSGDLSNRISWRVDSSGSYAGGAREDTIDAGEEWVTLSAQDMMFEEWGTEIPIHLSLTATINTRADVVLTIPTAPIELELRSSTDNRADLSLDTSINVALRFQTDTRATITLTVTAVTELSLRSSTDTRADITLDTLILLGFKSSTDTRASLALEVVPALACRSFTDTRASLALDTLISLALRSHTDTRASLELEIAVVLALRSITDTRASLALSALVSLELRSISSTRAAILLTISLLTEIECRSVTATRTAIQLNTLISLALLSQTATRADLLIATAFRHQEMTMTMQDRSLPMSMQERELSMSMPSRTFDDWKVRQNG